MPDFNHDGEIASLRERHLSDRLALEASDAEIRHDELPVARADSGQLVRLIQNLMGTPVKFREVRRPSIHFCAQLRDRVRLSSLEDNGIGIASDYSDRVFKIFHRLHSREPCLGTGKGLAVCQNIVPRHGGRIGSNWN